MLGVRKEASYRSPVASEAWLQSGLVLPANGVALACGPWPPSLYSTSATLVSCCFCPQRLSRSLESSSWCPSYCHLFTVYLLSGLHVPSSPGLQQSKGDKLKNKNNKQNWAKPSVELNVTVLGPSRRYLLADARGEPSRLWPELDVMWQGCLYHSR